MSQKLKDETQNFNPSQRDWDNNVSLSLRNVERNAVSKPQAGTNNSTDETQKSSADPSKDSLNSDINKSRDNTRNQERKSTKSSDTTHDNLGRPQRTTKTLGFMKRKGPLGIILAVFLSGGSIFSILSGVGLGAANLKDAILDDVNELYAALDKRSQHVYVSKINKSTKGLCLKKTSFKCRYKSISKKHALRMTKNGVFLDPKTKNKLGRYTPQSISFTDADGNRVKVEAKDFREMYFKNKIFREKMNRIYNPKWYAIRDKVGQSILKHVNADLKRKLSGSRDKMKKQVRSYVDKGKVKFGLLVKKTDADGNVTYEDGNGNKVSAEDAKRGGVNPNKLAKSLAALEKSKNSVKGMLSNGMKGANFFFGAQAGACTIVRGIETVSIASKALRHEQLIRLAIVHFNTVDSVVNGSAVMEAVSFINDALTHIDTRTEVLLGSLEDKITRSEIASKGEDALSGVDILELAKISRNSEGQLDIEPTENPNYGQDGFSSEAFQMMAFGAAPNLSLRAQPYMLGGGISGILSFVAQEARNVPGISKENCRLWENPIVQSLGLAASLGALIGSGFTSAGIQAAKMGFQIAATTVAMNLLMNKVNDILSPDSIANEDEIAQGVDYANATSSGGMALAMSGASSHGMTPVSSESELQTQFVMSSEYKKQYTEVAKYRAEDSPLNIYDQYSFLGIAARAIMPLSTEITAAKYNSFLVAPFSILINTGKILSPIVKAETPPMERFRKCSDPGYEKINLNTADTFCNIRFSLSEEEANADPGRVAQWMVNARQIDPVSGEPLRDKSSIENFAKIPISTNEVASVLAPMESTTLPPLTARTASLLPPPINTNDGDESSTGVGTEDVKVNFAYDVENPEEDVRTYAHWYRYCRLGDENGRKLGFGDLDSNDEDSTSLVKGIPVISDDFYQSDGRECLRKNNCKPGDNPNGVGKNQQERLASRCRPPQYSIYSVFHIDKTIDEAFDIDEAAEGNDGSLASGDVRELSQKLADNENMSWQAGSIDVENLKKVANGEPTFGPCGKPMVPDKLFLQVMLKLLESYKIAANNIGFQGSRSCDSGQHPQGKAIDITHVEALKGPASGKKTGPTITYGSSEEVAVLTQFSSDWMDAAGIENKRAGRAGQVGCGGFDLISIKKPEWEGADGNLHFSDSCNHLHIDVGDR